MARGSLSALDKALNKKYKEFDTTISKTGSQEDDYMIVPTFSIGINQVLGNGGVPLGKLILIKGPESSAKTAIGFSILASIQKNIGLSGKRDSDGDLIEKGNVALIDAERSYSRKWTEKMGVDTSEECFRFVHPPSGEIGLEFVEEMIRSGLYDAILVDSLNALMPTAMIENDMGDATMGAQARMISKAYGRIVGLADTYKTTLISISQERNTMSAYEKPALAGGKATRFYNHVILDIRRREYLGSKENPTGIRSKIKGEKNKVSTPHKACEVDLYYENGFDFTSDCINYAVNLGLIEKGGAWYTLQNGERFQGAKAVATYYKENIEEYNTLYKTVSNILSQTSSYDENIEEGEEDDRTEED